MNEIFLQYGLIGAIVVALGMYIIRIESRHKKERDDWRNMQEKQYERMEKRDDESNRISREHISILSGLKTLLENRR